VDGRRRWPALYPGYLTFCAGRPRIERAVQLRHRRRRRLADLSERRGSAAVSACRALVSGREPAHGRSAADAPPARA
jgi:hypothetical protein